MKLAALVFVSLVTAALATAEKPAAASPADLSHIEAEPNLEKRARAALDNADHALRRAEESHAKGDSAGVSAGLEEVEKSVNLADSSLKKTGKNPSRSPKHFKLAELRTRELLRKLDAFRDEMSVADRPVIERVAASVQKVHDELLEGIMGKRK